MRRSHFHQDRPSNPAGGIVGALMGLIFGGIGISVLAFLWGTPSNQFGAPPLFFRVFGSLIATAFVVTGGSALFAAMASIGASQDEVGAASREAFADRDEQTQRSPCAAGYTCPQCSAPLADRAEVSPHGDVRCVYCNCWFNIHAR